MPPPTAHAHYLTTLCQDFDRRILTRDEVRDNPTIKWMLVISWTATLILGTSAVTKEPDELAAVLRQSPLHWIVGTLAFSLTIGRWGVLADRPGIGKTLELIRFGYLLLIASVVVLITAFGAAALLGDEPTDAKLRSALAATVMIFGVSMSSVMALVPLVSLGRRRTDEGLTRIVQGCFCLSLVAGPAVVVLSRLGPTAMLSTLAVVVPPVLFAFAAAPKRVRELRQEIVDRLIDLEHTCRDLHAGHHDLVRAVARVTAVMSGNVPAILLPIPVADSGIRLLLRYIEGRYRLGGHNRKTTEWFETRLQDIDGKTLQSLLSDFCVDVRDLAQNRRPARTASR